jgi:hypothetical protein
MKIMSRQAYAETVGHGHIEQPKTWLVVNDDGKVLAEAESEAAADAELAGIGEIPSAAKVTVAEAVVFPAVYDSAGAPVA